MSRTSAIIQTGHTSEKIDEIIAGFMKATGFHEIDYKGERVMKKIGITFVPMYLKVIKLDGGVRIEGWVRSFGEHGLSGRVGLLPKYMLKKAIDRLTYAINPKIYSQLP